MSALPSDDPLSALALRSRSPSLFVIRSGSTRSPLSFSRGDIVSLLLGGDIILEHLHIVPAVLTLVLAMTAAFQWHGTLRSVRSRARNRSFRKDLRRRRIRCDRRRLFFPPDAGEIGAYALGSDDDSGFLFEPLADRRQPLSFSNGSSDLRPKGPQLRRVEAAGA
jgi:hypothetical protein